MQKYVSVAPVLPAGPTSFRSVSAEAPFANLYYTVEVPGVVKYIALTSYAPGQTFSTEEEQYVWLEQELKKVRVAWLAVLCCAVLCWCAVLHH